MTKRQFTFPPEKELEKVIKRFSDPHYRRVNQGLKPNATTEEKIKYELCENISHHTRENDLAEKELGQKLGIDQIKIEYILLCQLNKLSLKALNSYVDKLVTDI